MFFSVIQYMNLPKAIRDLCTPAQVYLGISVIAFIVILIQNFGNKNKYCVGNYSCSTEDLAMIFIGKILYIAFWTFILNFLCEEGWGIISWFMVLIPFVMFFVFIAAFMFSKQGHHPMVQQEGGQGQHPVAQTHHDDPVPQYGPDQHFRPGASVDFTGEPSGYAGY